jgi:Putative lumazine-binding
MTINAIPSVALATKEDIRAIIETARDYAEGWFNADAARMERALHPELVKRTIWHDLQEGTWKVSRALTAETMVGFTRDGGGSKRPDYEKVFEIEVLDVFRYVATVKVSSYPYMDYLHLAKLDGRWRIVNCLYALREGEETEP